MRWFKHLSDSHNNEVMSELMDEFGAEGYGVWWLILEKIAKLVDEKKQTFARYSVKVWANSCRVSAKKFKNITEFLQKKEIFFLNYEDDYLSIECPKLLKYRDEWTKKKNKKQEKLQSNSGVTPEQLQSKEYRIQNTDTDTETDILLNVSNETLSVDEVDSSTHECAVEKIKNEKSSSKVILTQNQIKDSHNSTVNTPALNDRLASCAEVACKDSKGAEVAQNQFYENSEITACEEIKIKKQEIPNCPHEKIIDLYHQILPMCPKVLTWNAERQKYLRARWKEYPELHLWEQYFHIVAQSKFLTGKVNASPNRKVFLATLEWLVRPTNFANVLERKYHER